MHEYEVQQIQPSFLSPTTSTAVTTTTTTRNTNTHHHLHFLTKKQTIIPNHAMASEAAANLQNKNITGNTQRPQSDNMHMLSSDFAPGDYDVICQRGKDSFEHVGNQRFRKCIDSHLSLYMSATTRQEKSSIVSKIYNEVRQKASKPGGGFVKKDLLTRMWFQVSEKEARDKVGQALRDAIKIVRGPSSRRKASGNIDGTPCQKRKKIRTSVDVPGRKQTQLDTSLKMALGGAGVTRRFDHQATGNANSTRSFLENQVNALGPFPMSATGGGAYQQDADNGANNMKSMLESVIEPLDSFKGQQNIDLSKLNTIKRRLSISQDPFTAANLFPLDGQTMEQQMAEQLAQKRALSQMFGTSATDFGSALPSMGTLRRLSLLGDQFFGNGDNGQQASAAAASSATAANLQSNHAGLLGLSSFGGALDFMNGGGFGAASALSMQQQQQQQSLQDSTATTSGPLQPATVATVPGQQQAQSAWDLEPTPLSGSQQPASK